MVNGSFHFLDSVRFCYTPRGSLTEAQSYIALAHDLSYLPNETYKRITSHAESIDRQFKNYIASLKRFKQGEKEFYSSFAVREKPEPHVLDYPEEDSAH